MSEKSGFKPLWREPRYPGDYVRIMPLKRGNEVGDIRIQHIRQGCVKVCSFLPGVIECSPGDTPKTWPEVSKFITNGMDTVADELFDVYVQDAFQAGWQRDYQTEERYNERDGQS